MFYLIFFSLPKEGRDAISHVIRAFFLHKLASFCCFFSANLYTVLPLSDYYSIFKAEANENWARSLKVA